MALFLFEEGTFFRKCSRETFKSMATDFSHNTDGAEEQKRSINGEDNDYEANVQTPTEISDDPRPEEKLQEFFQDHGFTDEQKQRIPTILKRERRITRMQRLIVNVTCCPPHWTLSFSTLIFPTKKREESHRPRTFLSCNPVEWGKPGSSRKAKLISTTGTVR